MTTLGGASIWRTDSHRFINVAVVSIPRTSLRLIIPIVIMSMFSAICVPSAVVSVIMPILVFMSCVCRPMRTPIQHIVHRGAWARPPPRIFILKLFRRNRGSSLVVRTALRMSWLSRMSWPGVNYWSCSIAHGAIVTIDSQMIISINLAFTYLTPAILSWTFSCLHFSV